jgi:hypothetical protein
MGLSPTDRQNPSTPLCRGVFSIHKLRTVAPRYGELLALLVYLTERYRRTIRPHEDADRCPALVSRRHALTHRRAGADWMVG